MEFVMIDTNPGFNFVFWNLNMIKKNKIYWQSWEENLPDSFLVSAFRN